MLAKGEDVWHGESCPTPGSTMLQVGAAGQLRNTMQAKEDKTLRTTHPTDAKHFSGEFLEERSSFGQGAENSSRYPEEDVAQAEIRREVEVLGGPSSLWMKMCRDAELEAGKFPCGFLGCYALDSDADGFVTKQEFVQNFEAYLNEITHVNTDKDPELLDSQVDHGEKPHNASSSAPDNGKLLLTSVRQSSATRSQKHVQNHEQKIWAAKQLPKLEGTICKRKKSDIERCCGPKLFSTGCPWGYNNVGFWCRGCKGESELLGHCWSRCGDDHRLPHLTHGCELGVVAYCTDKAHNCIKQALTLGIAWAKMFFSFTPVGMGLIKVVQGVKMTAEPALAPVVSLMKIAIKRGRAAAKQQHAKDILSKYMKKNGLAISSEHVDDIIDGGFELIGLQTIKNPDKGFLDDVQGEVKERLQKVADQAISLIDPFGVYDVVKAFDVGSDCEDVEIDPFPEGTMDNGPLKFDLDGDNDGCPSIKDEESCITSKDGRSWISGQPCQWCCGRKCTKNGNRCEPKSWLFNNNDYIGLSMNGIGDSTCPEGIEDLETANSGCQTLTDETSCLKSKDGRSWISGQPCQWCCGQQCTPEGNLCEPKSWLFARHDYIGESMNGFEGSCP